MQQATARQNDAITSGVNEGRFIAHIRELFSSSTIALGEIAQNARRAQATKVMFDLSEDGKTLVVTDDGIGIDDFQKLIVIAESGWSDELMAEESPFGIGFASVCFTADLVKVESKGRQVIFTTDDLVSKRPIPVTASHFIGGTRLTLTGFKVELTKALDAVRRLAKGFPIPVILNGEEQLRPHAKSNIVGVETEIGFVHVPGIHSDYLNKFCFRGHVYCQGLPVNVAAFTDSGYHRSEEHVVIHIDHRQFKPRVPDRDSLIDAADVGKRIEEVLSVLMRAHLEEQKKVLPAEAFANVYWSIASYIRARHIMNDVPVLPREVLQEFGVTLCQTSQSNDSWERVSISVTREQVESGAVVLFDSDLCESSDGDNFARMAFAKEKGWIHCQSLPEGHWAKGYIRYLEDQDCQLGGEIIAEGYFDGEEVCGGVMVVEDLTVTLGDETVCVSEPIAVNLNGAMDGMLIPKSARHAASVLRQVSTYTDEWGSYDDSKLDRDSDEFENLVTMLKGEPAAQTLAKCLHNIKSRTNLRGKTFVVSVGMGGELSVTER